MRTHTAIPVTAVAEHPRQSERRHGVRTPTILSILYSGMDSGQMLMGNGVVTNLSSSGIGICGDRSVTPGMEVALFVNLPGVEEPLCIAQSRVSWVEGRQFGVELGTLKLEEKNNLGFFLWDCVTHAGRDGGI
ncbi:MAG TPA: PilZ domain-containing protein [Nitrospiraceae bacterium]